MLLFSACSNDKQTNKTPKTHTDVKNIKIGELTLTFKKNKLIYPINKVILLFENGNTYSKAQKAVLKKLNVLYYSTNNDYLKNYFNVQTYPTIVVLDKNKTIKYENFTPYEILKAEGF